MEENEILRADRDAWKEQAADWKRVADDLVDEKLAKGLESKAKDLAEMRGHEIGAFCAAAIGAIRHGTAVGEGYGAQAEGRLWA